MHDLDLMVNHDGNIQVVRIVDTIILEIIVIIFCQSLFHIEMLEIQRFIGR